MSRIRYPNKKNFYPPPPPPHTHTHKARDGDAVGHSMNHGIDEGKEDEILHLGSDGVVMHFFTKLSSSE